MPDQTTVYAIPFPVLTDPPNVPSDMQSLAQGVEDALIADVRPVGDSSNSLYLTGADVAFTSGADHNILTTSITLLRDQWVIVSARAEFVNQGSPGGGMGIYVDMGDGVEIPQLTSGVQTIGASGSATERVFFTLPAYAMFLTAGAHTLRLRGDHAVFSSTVNAAGSQATANGHTHYPCYLSIIV